MSAYGRDQPGRTAAPAAAPTAAVDGVPQRRAAVPRAPRSGHDPAPHRHWRRTARLLAGIVVLGVVVALVLRAPAAASDFTSAFGHFQVDRLPWLGVAAALEVVSIAAAALVQRRFLAAGGHAVPFGTLLGLTTAATAVVDLVPVGVAPASGWLVEQYHARDVPLPLATWAVLASGFAATVSVLGLLLVGAGVAGAWTLIGLAVAGFILVAGSTGFVVLVHRIPDWEGRFVRHLRKPFAATLAQAIEHTMTYRVSIPGGAEVIGWSVLNWLLDAGVLVLAFAALGFAVPWKGVLFAYAASQVAGGLSFLPAGLGAVEGGIVGGFLLVGLPAANALAVALVYRVVAYWAVGLVGAVVFIVQTRRLRARQAESDQAAPVAVGGATASSTASATVDGP